MLVSSRLSPSPARFVRFLLPQLKSIAASIVFFAFSPNQFSRYFRLGSPPISLPFPLADTNACAFTVVVHVCTDGETAESLLLLLHLRLLATLDDIDCVGGTVVVEGDEESFSLDSVLGSFAVCASPNPKCSPASSAFARFPLFFRRVRDQWKGSGGEHRHRLPTSGVRFSGDPDVYGEGSEGTVPRCSPKMGVCGCGPSTWELRVVSGTVWAGSSAMVVATS